MRRWARCCVHGAPLAVPAGGAGREGKGALGRRHAVWKRRERGGREEGVEWMSARARRGVEFTPRH